MIEYAIIVGLTVYSLILTWFWYDAQKQIAEFEAGAKMLRQANEGLRTRCYNLERDLDKSRRNDTPQHPVTGKYTKKKGEK